MNLWNLASLVILSYQETSYILQEILPAFGRIGIIEPSVDKSNSLTQDEPETNTQQEIKQKNVGSGESTNNNCTLNSIDTTTVATVACIVVPPT